MNEQLKVVTEPAKGDREASPVSSLDRFDPLLGCLEIVAHILGVPFSRAGAITGLPLNEGKLSVDLFERAAMRMGMMARVVGKKPTRIAPITVPFIALLQGNDAAVVTALVPEQRLATLIFPSAPHLPREVPYDWLAKQSVGHVILVTCNQSSSVAGGETGTTPRTAGHWFWSPVLAFWPSFANIMIAALVINVIALATPLFIMNVYDRVVPNLAIPTLWPLSAGVAVALFFDLLLRQLRAIVLDWTGRRVDMSVSAHLFEHVLSLKAGDRKLTAGAMANSLREFEVIREFFTSSSLIALMDLLFIGVFLAVIWYLVGPLCLVPIVTVPTVLLLTLIFQLPIGRSVARSMAEASQRHSVLVETLVGIDSIKAAAAEGSMQRRWETAIAATARANSQSRFWTNWINNLTSFVQQTSSIIIVIWGVFLIVEGSITVGALIATSILTGRALAPLAGIAGTLGRGHQAFQAMRDINRIMQLPSEAQATQVASTLAKQPIVEFANVTFRYPDSEVDTLSEVSFVIKPGERVGIIGRVGSGKSTLGRLLIGFYAPDKGNVLLDAMDLRSFDPADVRAVVGYVPQDPELFTGTVRDNIIMGTASPDPERFKEVLKVSGVAGFTTSHPNGIGMQVGERGRGLSGGQRQAVALARILMRDTGVLFLDESSSAMDTATEASLCEALDKWVGTTKTLVVATHRGSMLGLVNRLIVLDNGKVMADGPKADVLRYLQQRGAENRARAGLGDKS